jgi:hypothetical protein
MHFGNDKFYSGDKMSLGMEVMIPWRERQDSPLPKLVIPSENKFESLPQQSSPVDSAHSDEVLPLNIRPEDAVVAVIGVGYVGVHLVENFGTQYPIIAFDVSKPRLDSLSSAFAGLASVSRTTNTQMLKRATHFLISVPTPVLPDRSINTNYLKAAIATVREHARQGATVVIESSVAVGMTRELLGPLMREKGIKGGMSPEVSTFDAELPKLGTCN